MAKTDDGGLAKVYKRTRFKGRSAAFIGAANITAGVDAMYHGRVWVGAACIALAALLLFDAIVAMIELAAILEKRRREAEE